MALTRIMSVLAAFEATTKQTIAATPDDLLLSCFGGVCQQQFYETDDNYCLKSDYYTCLPEHLYFYDDPYDCRFRRS
uniref:Chitin-binding type-2 domain-containing protein n=1 Tax=Panagrellus redivivus TaxID=6233 RepID=A0A7E4ZX37_PANRE